MPPAAPLPDATQQDLPEPRPDAIVPAINQMFLQVEHVIYAALGSLLALVAVAALLHAALAAAASLTTLSNAAAMLEVVDQLLFVLMLVEILHTVRVSLRSGTLNPEPFLIVGLIASIRRVLVITLESAGAAKGQAAAEHAGSLFRDSMTELVVLSLLITVMVASIALLRRGPAAHAAGSIAAAARGPVNASEIS